MRLLAGIDTAMPDVGAKWNYHAEWNQHTQNWREDFRQLAACGFDLLRWQTPWSLVEPSPGEYRWELLDPQVELATDLGMEMFYPIAHFNLPSWIAQKNDRHAVYSAALAERLAIYTGKLLERYRFRMVIPVVEVQMEACQRGLMGSWQPHVRSRAEYRKMHANLVSAFRASAAVARQYGATVVCSEPATEIETVMQLRDDCDLVGIDLYPHMHRQRSVLNFLRLWWKKAGKPICLSEFGTPETYDPRTGVDEYARFVEGGMDGNRVLQAQKLHTALQKAADEGIDIPVGGWYPGTGNIGWGSALTQERAGLDCDRAGLVDLVRGQDGTLRRVLCPELVNEVKKLAEIRPTMKETGLPKHGLASMGNAVQGALNSLAD